MSKPVNVTIDTNCIIALENAEKSAPFIKDLLHFSQEGKINLRLVGISASEKQSKQHLIRNFKDFQKKVTQLGLDRLEILKPIGYWGITFWDWCLYSSEEMENLEKKIHEILFPEIEFRYEDFCKKREIDPASSPIDPHWRNAKCDVLALWCHINYGGGVFVTEDKNFMKASKLPALVALGAGSILTPENVKKYLF